MKYNSAQIIYASASGNTRFVAEEIFQKISKVVDSRIDRADDQSFKLEFNNDKLYIFATSTWEHGVINPYFKPILDQLKKEDLKGIDAVFVGTGDMRYEPVLFCGGMEEIRKVFKDSGGTEILSPLRIDGEPRKAKDTIIKKWSDNLLSKFDSDE